MIPEDLMWTRTDCEVCGASITPCPQDMCEACIEEEYRDQILEQED
jgi:hypothetical protein